ncbi:MAG: AAA family ATPase [Mediterraneibacter faecis]
MKINKIVLYNFNSFEGMNEFDFSSTCDQKNIVLIGGKNGAGKTSLFTAIKIALYGPLTYGYMGLILIISQKSKIVLIVMLFRLIGLSLKFK